MVSALFYSSYFLRRRRKITCPRITSRSMNAPRYPTNRRLFSTPQRIQNRERHNRNRQHGEADEIGAAPTTVTKLLVQLVLQVNPLLLHPFCVSLPVPRRGPVYVFSNHHRSRNRPGKSKGKQEAPPVSPPSAMRAPATGYQLPHIRSQSSGVLVSSVRSPLVNKNFLYRSFKKIRDGKGQFQRGVVFARLNRAHRLPGYPDHPCECLLAQPRCFLSASTLFSIRNAPFALL